MKTHAHKKQEIKKQIRDLTDYLTNCPRDHRDRETAWMITQRDDQDEEKLIQEIARLKNELNNMLVATVDDPLFFDRNWEYEYITMEASENTILKHEHSNSN